MAATAGHVEAQYQAALFNDRDSIDGTDQKKAVVWMQMAAENGHPQAQLDIGRRYFSGTEGLPRDDVQSYLWITLASDQAQGEAGTYLSELRARMSPGQILEALALVREQRRKTRSPPSGQ